MNKTTKEIYDEYGLTIQTQCKIRRSMNPPMVMEKIDYRGRVMSVYSGSQVQELLSAKSLFTTKLNGQKILAKKIRELN